MKALIMPLVLQFAGLVVVIAEIFVPSGGILALIALGLLGYALFIVFQDISTTAGIYFVLADLVILPVLIIYGLKILAKSPATLRQSLTKEAGVVSQAPELVGYLGENGESITDLHPGGMALIGGKRLDVVSRGEYIEKGRAISVVEVTGNQIIVGEINEEIERG